MTVFSSILLFCVCLLALSILLALYRFVVGPSLADRLSALDLISVYLLGLLITYVMFTDKLIFFDVALVFSLIAFLGAISFAYYLVNQKEYE
ncbi:monovalent cation/H+ antiporter complex subunit F [Olivibacter sp. XZL3]|uniref:monovalent cation/H+ antiporter complex subunit F n=1 Tax=Olivibacter sp. XZL3 TaxID=1735116 RepID=UPI00106710FF|nr:monovalent cation/H+ antiporter complex subunit F [Olivibacter sp. XZL3]